MNMPSGASLPPVDLKDPRIRVTAADVWMRFANDGPMYGMIILAGVLAFKGITTGLESIVGGMFALQARSRPPENDKNAGRLFLPLCVAGALVSGSVVVGCL